MGMNYKYVSIDRIFAKFIRDVGEDFSEEDVIEWCGEALEFIGAINYYEEAVYFSEVKNHQCDLPKFMHSIIQIARDCSWNGTNPSCGKVAESISEEVFTFFTTSQHGLVLNDQEIPYYKSSFSLRCGFNSWCGCGYYGSYSPVRLKNHTLFNSIVCPESPERYAGCIDEYTIIQGKIARFSFKEGFVAIPYTRQVMDELTGYPQIPDNISYTTAITWYIKLKLAEKDFEKSREGAKSRMDNADAKWQWYCAQASNVDKMLFGIDEHQNFLDQRSYLLPRNNRYFGFFGNLARPEARPWNDPSHRNNHGGSFIGN